jgi:hypothetical protein
MKKAIWVVALFAWVPWLSGQIVEPNARIANRTESAYQVTVVEVATHFVSAIRVPEAVTSVAVGDPTLFQVEHSDREPQLIFVKVLTIKPAESNLLITTAKGRELSLLLVSKGEEARPNVDFLVNYRPETSFVIEPSAPSVGVSETVEAFPIQPTTGTGSLGTPSSASGAISLDLSQVSLETPVQTRLNNLEELLERQKRAPLPELYGEHPTSEVSGREPVRAGVSEVIDGGNDVIVLFSAVNPENRAILLMPPQVQLGGETKQGKLIKRPRWTSAEQLPVIAYRLSKRRIAPGERADGVVIFERPPYKQSNETLFLQIAEAGAVDHPALAPIGFGISTSQEDSHDSRNTGK